MANNSLRDESILEISSQVPQERSSTPEPQAQQGRSLIHSKFPMTPTKGHKTCQDCSRKYSSNTSITTLRKHFKTNHPAINIENNIEQKSLIGSKKMTLEENKHLNMQILKVIVDNYLPISLFTDVTFKNTYTYLNKTAKIWCRPTAISNLKALYDESKIKLNTKIQALKSKISISTDLWTAINSTTFCAITMHFVNEDWELENYLLAFVDFPYPHRSGDIRNLILKVINEHGLSRKLLTITHDNGGNVVNASREIVQLLKDTHQNECYNIRCLAHTVNIIARSGLASLSAHLEKVHEFVRKLHTSPQFFQKFKGLAGPLIPLDVSTRWNSTYLMLTLINKNYTKINELCSLSDGIQITIEEFNILKKIELFFLPFYNVTNLISSNTSPTVAMALIYIKDLYNQIQEKILLGDPIFQDACQGMHLKCLKYLNEYETFNFYVAGYLDPRIKKSVLPAEINTAANYEKLKSLHLSYVDVIPFPMETVSQDYTMTILNRLRNQTQLSREHGDELQDYEKETPISTNTVLEWWKMNETRFPALSKMAKDYLGQSTTSVPSERMFSLAGNIVTARRNRLSSNTITQIMCVKSWGNVNFT